MNNILYAAATAAVKTAIETRNADLDRAIADTGAALLTAVRSTIINALPAAPDGEPHPLQPLANLVADCVTLSGNAQNGLVFEQEAIDLLYLADDATGHAIQKIMPGAVRSVVRHSVSQYEQSLLNREIQAKRLTA